MLKDNVEGFRVISEVAALTDAQNRGIVNQKGEKTSFGKWLTQVGKDTDNFRYEKPILSFDKLVEAKLKIVNELFDIANGKLYQLGQRQVRGTGDLVGQPVDLSAEELERIGISKEQIEDLKNVGSDLLRTNMSQIEEGPEKTLLLKKLLSSRLTIIDEVTKISLSSNGKELRKVIESGNSVDLGMDQQWMASSSPNKPVLHPKINNQPLSDGLITASANLVSLCSVAREWAEKTSSDLTGVSPNNFIPEAVTSQLFKNIEDTPFEKSVFVPVPLNNIPSREFYKASPILSTLPTPRSK